MIWYSNDTFDTLDNVVITVDFYNLRWYRSEGSKDYAVGTLGCKEMRSLNYSWDNWENAPVVPRVRVRYTQPGLPGIQTVQWDGFGY